MMKYEIGQEVWVATWDASPSCVTCPDCGGTGRLRLIFHDDTEVSIECRNCCSGYDPPSGRVKIYTREPRAVLATITGVEIEGSKTEWRTDKFYRIPENEIFDSQDLAMAAACSKANQADTEERQRVFQKEKDTRSWAWNASYHRKCIKEAQHKIEYHSAKLAVAAIKAKEDKAA
jgi:hypothetical protein